MKELSKEDERELAMSQIRILQGFMSERSKFVGKDRNALIYTLAHLQMKEIAKLYDKKPALAWKVLTAMVANMIEKYIENLPATPTLENASMAVQMEVLLTFMAEEGNINAAIEVIAKRKESEVNARN